MPHASFAGTMLHPGPVGEWHTTFTGLESEKLDVVPRRRSGGVSTHSQHLTRKHSRLIRSCGTNSHYMPFLADRQSRSSPLLVTL